MHSELNHNMPLSNSHSQSGFPSAAFSLHVQLPHPGGARIELLQQHCRDMGVRLGQGFRTFLVTTLPQKSLLFQHPPRAALASWGSRQGLWHSQCTTTKWKTAFSMHTYPCRVYLLPGRSIHVSGDCSLSSFSSIQICVLHSNEAIKPPTFVNDTGVQLGALRQRQRWTDIQRDKDRQRQTDGQTHTHTLKFKPGIKYYWTTVPECTMSMYSFLACFHSCPWEGWE